MLGKCSICAVLAAGVIVPASAADVSYILQMTGTKKCMIVENKPPNMPAFTVVGNPDGYKTRAEAEAAMKALPECPKD